jgi:ribonuclease HI
MTERGTSARDGSGRKARYHLLTTDGGIVPDQPGKTAGEAAIGVVIKAPLEEISEPIGRVKDPHVAEYRALIRGLEAARFRGIEHLRVCLDSLLLVNQLNGRSQVSAEHLKPLHKQAASLIQQFPAQRLGCSGESISALSTTLAAAVSASAWSRTSALESSDVPEDQERTEQLPLAAHERKAGRGDLATHSVDARIEEGHSVGPPFEQRHPAG